MINPNELRIGNWVYDILADVNVEVIGIDQYEIFTEDIGGVQEICNCKDIDPIPLTDEFCTKQGWEKVGYYYTDKNGLEIYETNDGWHLHIDDEKCQTTIAILINSVHELQNAYFIVTKKRIRDKVMNNKDKPKMHIASCSFGKDSIATILLALENNEPLDRVVFSEVMFDHSRNISGELPEHIEWVHSMAIPRLEEMGCKVDVVKSKWDYVTLCKTILTKGKNKGRMYGLQNSLLCFANSSCKIEPIRAYLKQFNSYDITQYVGIAIDEPKRLERLKRGNKVSLLQKYGYTEENAMKKCEDYNLVSPLYSMGYRGGCWFCYNANIARFVHMRKNYPMMWQALRDLYYETNSNFFKYGKTLQEVELQMDAYEFKHSQPTLFD